MTNLNPNAPVKCFRHPIGYEIFPNDGTKPRGTREICSEFIFVPKYYRPDHTVGYYMNVKKQIISIAVKTSRTIIYDSTISHFLFKLQQYHNLFFL